ncbi:DUF3048 domain-containing protein [Halalkalibacillus halophilus]|uniref:DUF3048 domain-containing protein n=1 Tax=Halalkalibacillus halophilus TaxID=392827 RepID=UPI0003F9FF72|nr:DUF3048 domain-containing protein [Halalkalibacillus halophilus]
MRKWWLVLTVLLAFSMILVACNDEEAAEEEEPEVEEEVEEEDAVEEETEPDEEEEQTNEVPSEMYPLTGEGTNEVVDHRVLAVQINNHKSARPQTGLTRADVVYEFLAEGNITRLVALFHSDIPEVVGPVRSARSYYIETAKAHGAIYVYHGAADFIEDQIRAGWVDNLNGAYYDDDQFLFKRESFRQAPHNSYAYLENAYEVANRNDIQTEQEEFYNYNFLNEGDTVEGDSATEIELTYGTYNQVSYSYDEEENSYLRSSDGEVSRDLNTEEPLMVENVLIYETGHRVIDDEGRREIDIESEGNGYLIQNGVVQEIQWRATDGVMKPYIDGEEAPLVKGQTWINVIPTSPGLSEMVTYE